MSGYAKIARLRADVMRAGFWPAFVEVPLDLADPMVGSMLYGLKVRWVSSDQPLAILAHRPGKIGRYEVRIPERFEYPLTPPPNNTTKP